MTLKTVQQTTFNNFHQLSPIIVYETEIKGFLPSLYKSFEDGSFDNSTGKITGELNGKVLIINLLNLDFRVSNLKKIR